MKNKSVVFKEYSTALLTIGSVIAGTFNCLFYYVYDIWMYVYFLMNILIISALIYLCWRIHDRKLPVTGFSNRIGGILSQGGESNAYIS